jgi:uncharacterized protein affecting Mg2+/Co2+ transport
MMKKLFTILMFGLPAVAVFAQSPVEELQKQFARYQQHAVQEKLFVHTDKSFYLTGETMWFKIYNVDAGSHKASATSKVAYVEILNNEGRAVLQAKIGLGENNGNGNGSFLLPAHLATGSYLLRAYTHWMKNFGESYYFQQAISVVNASKRPNWQLLEKAESYTVKFFPEGGNLVNGLPGLVAFHITDQYGKGVEVAGHVFDSKQQRVAFCKSYKFGMGTFYFTPEAGNDYHAEMILDNGTKISTPLPKAFAQGYVMAVEEAGNNQLNVTVHSTYSKPVYLLAHTRNELKIVSAQNITGGKAQWVISKDQLGEGVSHITIFDEGRQPVCERLVFKKPTSKLSIDVKTDKTQYETRSQVAVDILAKNNDGQVSGSDLSMSVFLIDSLQSADINTIDGYYWLASDLNGTIERPGYYFSNAPKEQINIAIENLMLTHGWRRFRWEDVNANKTPAFKFLPEYEGLTINATITDKRSGNVAPGVLSYVSVVDEKFRVGNALSNAKGEAAFVAGNVFGPNELVLQTDSNLNRYRMDVVDPFAAKPAMLQLPRFAISDKWRAQLSDRFLNAGVYNSFQPLHVQQFLPPATNDTGVFYGSPDKTYYLDDFTRFPTMEEVMREYVSEVRIIKEKNKFRYEVMNVPAKLYFSLPPLVLLDGVPVFDVDKIVAFDPLKIRKMEVVGRKYFWGNIINNGIVSYTTYDGDLAGFELDPSAVIVEFQGLQLQREFYQPDYNTPEKKNSRVPDARNVLLWEPSLRTSTKGSIEKSFYTSDVPGKYIVVVQGMNNAGIPGSSITTITVTPGQDR